MKQIISLDLGTTKYCLALYRHHNGSEKATIDALCVEALGMKRGMLSDRNQCIKSLKQLCRGAKDTYGIQIDKAVVGIAGNHLRGRIVRVSINLNKQPVNHKMLLKLSEDAEKKSTEDGREILHTVLLNYQIDQRAPTEDPIGFSGDIFSGSFFIIDADHNYLRDVVNLCNSAGVEVQNLYAEPFASASVTLTEKEKEVGVALADIGGGTTDGVVFFQGKPVHLFTFDVAGQLMTSDIAAGLNVPLLAAEQVKKINGLLATTPKADYTNQLGEITEIGHENVYPILGARVLEWSKFVYNHAKLNKPLKAGLRLTGGGSQILGLKNFLRKTLDTHVELSYPKLFSHSHSNQQESDKDNKHPFEMNSKYATSLGLINLELQAFADAKKQREWQSSKRFLNRFVNWLRELS